MDASKPHAVSIGQNSLWLAYASSKMKNAYQVNFAWEIISNINETSFNIALNHVVECHPLLRTQFLVDEAGDLMQRICASKNTYLKIIDLDSESGFNETLNEYANQPLNLEQGEPFRFVLFKRPNKNSILFFSIHHIVTDMWSVALLMDELSYAYAKHQQNEPLEAVNPPANSYANFVAKQQKKVGGKKYLSAKNYWINSLKGMDPVLNLPTTYPRPIELDYQGGRTSFLIDNPLAEKVNALNQSLDINSYTFFMCAYQILLAKYSQIEDILLLTPTSLRRPKDSHTMGYYISPLIIKSSHSAETPCDLALKQTHTRVRESLFNQDYPLMNLFEDLNIPRDPSRAKLAQATFALYDPQHFLCGDYLDVSMNEQGKEYWNLRDLTLERLELRAQNDDSDLFLTLSHFDGKYKLTLEYNSNIFSESFATRFLNHLACLTESIVQTPHCTVSQLNMLTHKEIAYLNRRQEKTQQEVTQEKPTAISLFESFAEQQPNKVAVYHEQASMTYGALNAKANRLAHQLLSQNITQSTLVGVALDRTIEMLVAILGIIKAGAAYVPLDPKQPKDRLQYIFEATQLTYLVTETKHLKNFPSIVKHTLYLDKDIPSENQANPAINLTNADLIYCIFTSGSTGKPKGVSVEQRGIASLIEFAKHTYSQDIFQNVLASTSLNFDIHVFETWVPLAMGSSITLIDKPIDLVNSRLKDLVTFINTVPSAARVLIDLRAIPTNARAIILVGEPLTQRLVNDLYQFSELEMVCNLYGPTEDTVYSTYYLTHENSDEEPLIGLPLPGCHTYVLDGNLKPMPIGLPGELYLSGTGLAREYYGRSDLTTERFIEVDPFNTGTKVRMYKTGDIARVLECGQLEYLGRNDNQVKIRGYRIEIEEINTALRGHSFIAEAVTTTYQDNDKILNLVAFIVFDATSKETLSELEIRDHLRTKLPEYMIPKAFQTIDKMPLNSNGKIDLKALPPIDQNTVAASKISSKGTTQENKSLNRKIRNVWELVLDRVCDSDQQNFFDLGGTSLNLVKANRLLLEHYDIQVRITDLFQYPSIESLANFLARKQSKRKIVDSGKQQAKYQDIQKVKQERPLSFSDTGSVKVAIIGMSCHFPDAATPDEFWNNIISGKSSLKPWSREDLLASGRTPNEIDEKNFIPISGAIQNIDQFDADFFSMAPREAQITDPQHRCFLECAWQAIEDAAVNTDEQQLRMGIYAGAGESNYFREYISHNSKLMELVGKYATFLGNEKDFLSSRVAYLLNTQGPAVSIQTACSTSLYAVHMACMGLLNNDCNVAMAGGVSLGDFSKGYQYEQGMILSSDGHCRTFDENADGTVPSQGCGVVILKRIEDAVKDGDHVYAIISGSAVSNDGSEKVGFTAPSAYAQSQAIHQSMQRARVCSEQISLIEAHGTGTQFGDPVEMEGLQKAFSFSSTDRGSESRSKMVPYCAIGSVKSNIGHTDTAAGIAGLIKVVKAMQNKQLPPTIDFDHANNQINFDQSPFYVNTEAKHWDTKHEKRHAGVSSFGMGGTNAHVTLEEFLPRKRRASFERMHVLPLSAMTREGLCKRAKQLSAHLAKKPNNANYFSDLAYTLQNGRKSLNATSFFVAKNNRELVKLLDDESTLLENYCDIQKDHVLLMMFSGQGSQYQGMAQALYQSLPEYKALVDHSIYEFRSKHPQLYAEYEEAELLAQNSHINETRVTQIALFILEYHLAKMLFSWGIEANIMIGHSVGEYVAACLANVFEPADAMFLLAQRGKLIQSLAKGSMVSVNLSESEATAYLQSKGFLKSVDLAVINSTERCSLSGESATIENLLTQLIEDGIDAKALHVSHAFHSFMLDPILDEYRSHLDSIEMHPPNRPILSNVTGTWLTDEEATSSDYWLRHLRQTNRFSDGLATVFKANEKLCCLEIGPGRSLATFARQHKEFSENHRAITTLPSAKDKTQLHDSHDMYQIMQAIGKLWQAGFSIDWAALHQNPPQKVQLPAHPFNRKSFWLSSLDKSSLNNASTHTDSIFDDNPANNENVLTESSTNPTTRRLTDIWKTFLSLKTINEHADFFALGGDSLSALRLIKLINEQMNLALDSNTLIQNSSITKLSQAIDSLTQQSRQHTSEYIVKMHTGTSSDNLFLIHANVIGGHLYFYRELIQAWQPDLNIYGLAPRGYDGKETPPSTIEEIAKLYIQDIKAVQKKGPYRLGGSSFGGMVAYELAQLFREAGETVDLLFMVDTPGPQKVPAAKTNTEVLLFLIDIPLDREELLSHENDPDKQAAIIKEKAKQSDLSQQIPHDFNGHYIRSYTAYFHALTAYQARKYKGDLIYFKAREPIEHLPSFGELSWIPLVENNFNLYTIPGNHVTINYQPNVQQLANYLDRELKDSIQRKPL